MNATEILEQIRLIGLVPVIAIESAEDAEPLARALVEGGLPCAEVTFRTAAAQESIRRIARSMPGMLLGAGTVLSIDQVKLAVDCGARYIVSPGLNPKVVEYCVGKGIAVTPGISSPTDVEFALELGLSVVKFFPAEPAGGLTYLKSLAGPYGKVRYIPTGGIDESNLLSYLKFPKVFACGGSWMVKQDLIASKQFDRIRELTARAVQLMLGFALPEKGENGRVKVGSAWVSAGGGKTPSVGIGTHFPDRAAAQLQRLGYAVGEEKEGGRSVDLKVPGMDFRLMQKSTGPSSLSTAQSPQGGAFRRRFWLGPRPRSPRHGSASAPVPVALFVMQEIPSTRRPRSRATETSRTVDIPHRHLPPAA